MHKRTKACWREWTVNTRAKDLPRLYECPNLNLRMKWLKKRKKLGFSLVLCVCAECWAHALCLMPLTRFANDVIFCFCFIRCSLSVFESIFPCERQNAIRISSSIREERKKENLLLSQIFDLCNSFIHCHSCGSDVFSISFRSMLQIMFLFYLSYQDRETERERGNGNREKKSTV